MSFQGSRYYGTIFGGLLSLAIYAVSIIYLITLLQELFGMTNWNINSKEILTAKQNFSVTQILNGAGVILKIPATNSTPSCSTL